MRIPCRQRGLLRHMDRTLSRSDPHLAAMLALFARLYGSETITSPEQARHVRVLAALIWAGRTAVRALSRLAAGARRVIRHVAVACSRAHRRSPLSRVHGT